MHCRFRIASRESKITVYLDKMIGSTVRWTKCLKSNAPETFFVGWFLATPNISQVVYLAIAADSWGFNPQNIESKKQTQSSDVFAAVVVGFTLLPPRRWTMINAVPVQRLPSFPRPVFVNLLILSKVFVNLMIKHCVGFPAWVQGLGLS